MAGVSQLWLVGLLSGFVNKVLLEHSHMHSLTYCLWLPLHYRGSVEYLWESSCGPKFKIYTTWSLFVNARYPEVDSDGTWVMMELESGKHLGSWIIPSKPGHMLLNEWEMHVYCTWAIIYFGNVFSSLSYPIWGRFVAKMVPSPHSSLDLFFKI